MPQQAKKDERRSTATVRPEEGAKEEQMCCDGKRTAAEHRGESSDGRCCSDS